MRYFDFYLFVPYIILCCIGAVMVYSASSINLSYAGAATNTYLMKQLLYVVIGLGCVFFFNNDSDHQIGSPQLYNNWFFCNGSTIVVC